MCYGRYYYWIYRAILLRHKIHKYKSPFIRLALGLALTLCNARRCQLSVRTGKYPSILGVIFIVCKLRSSFSTWRNFIYYKVGKPFNFKQFYTFSLQFLTFHLTKLFVDPLRTIETRLSVKLTVQCRFQSI